MTAAAPTMTDPDRASAHARLLDLVDRHHGHVPCRCTDVAPPSCWTADDNDDQARAAAACMGCPVSLVVACQVYGLTFPREYGVYGAMTTDQRQPTTTTTRRRTA